MPDLKAQYRLHVRRKVLVGLALAILIAAAAAVSLGTGAYPLGLRDMADAVVRCAQLVREAVSLLQRLNSEASRISDLTAQISAIEGRADELHDIGLHELYRANIHRLR